MAKKRKRKINLPPGSVIYTGEQKSTESIITVLQFKPGELHESKLDLKRLPTASDDHVLWIDMRGVHDTSMINHIGTHYNIHSLALEDIADIYQRPKLDEYKNGLLLIAKALYVDPVSSEIVTEQLSVFQGADFVISFQENSPDLFEAIKKRLYTESGKIRTKKADYLLYALADVIVDKYYLVLDHLEIKLEGLEDQITGEPDPKTKENLHKFKREVTHIRKFLVPLRDAVGKWFRIDNSLIDEINHMYIRDLYDHLNQVLEILDSYRDMTSGLQDLYLSEISFRMNNVMQILTIIATIFIPLTFLAGIYGMNFEYIPELQWRYSYFVLWTIMVLVTFFLVRFFRKKGWL